MNWKLYTITTILATWASIYVEAQCSGTTQDLQATESLQNFETPDYPTSYQPNLNCTWLIDSGTAGQSVLLYSKSFYLACSTGDSVSIYDGSSVSDTPLASDLCLSTYVTTEYISTGRYVLVNFRSDGSISDGGFSMIYVSSADTSGAGCSTPTNITASASSNFLTSVGFPNIYSSLSSCRWLITAPGDLSTITVQFEFSDIESDSECVYDKVLLYDGYHICENKLLLTHCSSRPGALDTYASYTSTSNSLLVIFTSDSHDNYHGFILRYSASIRYTTTTASVATSTVHGDSSAVQCTQCSSGLTSEQQEKEDGLNVYILIACVLAGVAFTILAEMAFLFAKKLKERKRPKKGLIRVQPIAAIPCRTQLAPHRTSANALSFV